MAASIDKGGSEQELLGQKRNLDNEQLSDTAVETSGGGSDPSNSTVSRDS